jgi:delta1-piperideine-2-carboxylate reductase
MKSVPVSLPAIRTLVETALLANGCDEDNASAVARTVAAAERDGAESHGLFRVPGYVAALRSKRVRGDARPELRQVTPAFVHVNANHGFAPLALETGIPELARITRELGIGVMSVTDSFHFAALWPEVEALAENDLAGIACVNYAAVMAPHGGTRPIFGTNPIAFAWPRHDAAPVVVDMATSAAARGELMLARRAGNSVPPGWGLDASGAPSRDPAAILDGVQLPFGGHKGYAIALLVELLAASATGDRFSDEVVDDVKDGGPPPGGELVIALSPRLLGGAETDGRTAAFLDRLAGIPGVRLPGQARHQRRADSGPRKVNARLLERIRELGGRLPGGEPDPAAQAGSE